AWCGGDQDGTPDGPKLHSILIDPRDARHMYIGMSGGGVFESTDGGADWRPLNRGVKADFLPQPDPEYGHDPHCVRLHPALPDRLYQQNHCGIYRLDRPAERWEDIGAAMPRSVGPIGLPMVVHPREPDTVWVFPMDGTSVWPRVSPGGKPAVYRSVNAGKTWQRQANGLPKSQAWLTVKRQAMTADAGAPVGVYFGTTSGEIWGSRDEGRTWKNLAAHLPEVYAVETI
ncbi:MAG: WD40/YVTN/BNR-like repeat-containing protein, partial [Casimicrobiaceae bacterium]